MSGRHPQPPKRAGASKGQARPAPRAPAPRRVQGHLEGQAKAAEPTAAKKAPAEKAARAHPPGAVSALGLTKVYGDRPALAALDLHVPYGESLALVGHNGSGKTTFLRLAAGLLDASDGSVLDRRPSRPARSPPAPPSPTCRTHRRSTRTSRSGSTWSTSPGCTATRTGSRTAADLLDHLGLYDRADDLPTSFSRGLRQKASIAMGVHPPLRRAARRRALRRPGRVRQGRAHGAAHEAHGAGRTLLVATHELSYLETVNRCVALRDGELIYDGASKGIDVLSLVS